MKGNIKVYIVHVFIHVKPECVDEFREVSIENARLSLTEPGVARFDVIQQADDPTRFVLVEVYRSDTAPAEHKQTDHYNTWKDRAEKMMLEPRSRIVYRNVFPSDDRW
jgi:autoinducer 2-degrading protein